MSKQLGGSLTLEHVFVPRIVLGDLLLTSLRSEFQRVVIALATLTIPCKDLRLSWQQWGCLWGEQTVNPF